MALKTAISEVQGHTVPQFPVVGVLHCSCHSFFVIYLLVDVLLC